MQWLQDFIAQGGPVLYGIFALCFVLWCLILERLWFFYRDVPELSQAVAARWNERTDHHSWSARKIRTAWLSEYRAATTQYLSTIGILVSICPLMGLLGTVTGMISVFDVLAVTGTGNARAMANGISQATIPTMAGLMVALTALYFHYCFKRLSDQAVSRLANLLPTD